MQYLQALAGVFLIALTVSNNTNAQTPKNYGEQKRLPIIDMHVHAFGEEGYDPKEFSLALPGSESPEMLFQETYEQFRRFNVVKAVVSGQPEIVELWKSKDEDNRIIRGIVMLSALDHDMTPARFEEMVKTGKIEVYGEIISPLSGTTISDPEWQPYLKICEQYDIPLAIHTGATPPAIKGTWRSKTRLRLGDPYLIEDVVVRYPRLRIYMCHSGQQYHERVLTLMMDYSRLYSDLGWVLWGDPLKKRYAREFLANAKEAGCVNRIMFGSDQMYWPQAIEMSIEYLNSLDFLTEQDKRDILYNNAVRFLKLKE